MLIRLCSPAEIVFQNDSILVASSSITDRCRLHVQSSNLNWCASLQWIISYSVEVGRFLLLLFLFLIFSGCDDDWGFASDDRKSDLVDFDFLLGGDDEVAKSIFEHKPVLTTGSERVHDWSSMFRRHRVWGIHWCWFCLSFTFIFNTKWGFVVIHGC